MLVATNLYFFHNVFYPFPYQRQNSFFSSFQFLHLVKNEFDCKDEAGGDDDNDDDDDNDVVDYDNYDNVIAVSFSFLYYRPVLIHDSWGYVYHAHRFVLGLYWALPFEYIDYKQKFQANIKSLNLAMLKLVHW